MSEIEWAIEKKEYIERGALIAFVREVRKKLPKDSKDFFTRDEMLLNFQQYLESQKAADVEPVVRAKWEQEFKEVPVKDGSRCVMRVLYKCASEYGCKEYSIINSKRCPNCGAHMERSGSGE
jgi:hypothetical protein